MASTSAVVYIRPSVTAAVSARRSTGAVVYIPIREVAGVYNPGVTVTTNKQRDAWVPQPRIPLGTVNARGEVIINQEWRRFFDTVADRLGGYEGPRLPDVVTAVSTTQEAAIQSVAQVQAIAQQSQANAETLSAARQVLQNNALPGSDQIPPPVLSPYEAIQ